MPFLPPAEKKQLRFFCFVCLTQVWCLSTAGTRRNGRAGSMKKAGLEKSKNRKSSAESRAQGPLFSEAIYPRCVSHVRPPSRYLPLHRVQAHKALKIVEVPAYRPCRCCGGGRVVAFNSLQLNTPTPSIKRWHGRQTGVTLQAPGLFVARQRLWGAYSLTDVFYFYVDGIDSRKKPQQNGP